MSAKAQLLELWDARGPFTGRFQRVVKHIGLAKVLRSAAMAGSAAAAYAAKDAGFDRIGLNIVSCLFVVCLGAATLNNYQDRHIDGRLLRTRKRSLATGEIASQAALIQALVLLSLGMLGLVVVSGSAKLAVTGLIGVCLYNLIYTPLKKTTTLAIIPGAVCGVLPILMGWMAAGGEMRAPAVWILMVAFGVWQFPHFWLVLLTHRGDYSQSGLPNLLGVLRVGQLNRMVFVWSTLFAVLTLLFPLYRVVSSETAAWLLSANALVLTAVFGQVLFSERGEDKYRHLSRHLNLSIAVVMSVIIVDGVA